jgi:hypothetical protein
VTEQEWDAEEYNRNRGRGFPCPFTLAAIMLAPTTLLALLRARHRKKKR